MMKTLQRLFLVALGAASVSLAAVPAAEEKKWDIDNPPGPYHEVTLDSTEGTWLNLDVSPDGREIVFDLLGDLYSLPIAGGGARALTRGLAWDMQPRFSPDGRTIAFTSDRGGGDNIWIMDRDGANPRAVTQEDFQLLNSPAWTPDGQYIAARKHFTSTRSLGAGEVWVYHRSGGGQGVQMTKRPNDQKDLGEPAFSPDGRFLYYSQDATPGAEFEYSKNPHAGIYTIRRLDRQSGEIEDLTGGPGGAVRPTPSPDGRWLAFVRRQDVRTALFVRDLVSGREQAIYQDLDRDMQETWAIHGVYPTLAWTPDSHALVVWAGGKIWRVEPKFDASSVDSPARVTQIPFHVHTTRRIAEAVRYPVEVAPEKFPTRMLRWVQVSPRGDQVVYQALGHLYVRALPDGKPRRLTRQADHFEFYPSYSRDGKQIVYVSWNDTELGAVRVTPAGGNQGEGRKITAEPGHYIEPVFTPDGTQIVYHKVAGGGLMSPLYSSDLGLYAISARGGEPHRITRDGSRPQFGNRSDRVYFTRIGEKDKRSLYSTTLQGAEERLHVSSEAATEFRLSADGQWLAFAERFNVYVTPFLQAGLPIDTGPKSKAIPVVKVSANAGEYLHFSGDGRRLHWALGQELFSHDLSGVLSASTQASGKPPEPEAKGRPIGFEVATDIPQGMVAFVGARIVTMRGDEVIEDGTIVIDRNRIAAVGARNAVKVPAAATVVDVSGQTILPGLIDVHAHGAQGSQGLTPQQNYGHFSSLSFGVTTTHDPSADTGMIFAASEMARAGLITAPRIFSTGIVLYGAAGDFKAEIDSYEDALRHLQRMQAVGAFSVKSYNQPRRNQRQQVIAAARELHMMVVPEGGSLFEHNMTMIADGHTGIEHSIPVPRVYEDVLQFWGGSQTGYTPTLGVAYGGLWGENYWYQHTPVWKDPRLLSFVPADMVRARARRGILAGEDDFNHINNARIAKQLVDRGVHVQLGAHGQREGLAAHWELWSFGQGGMTPLEALRCGTLYGAAYLGLDQDLGSLEVGKLADLIVLEKNPLEELRNSETVRLTMVNGRLYEAATLNEIGNHPHRAQPFYFQRGMTSGLPGEAVSRDID